jgi:hypothetical protein
VLVTAKRVRPLEPGEPPPTPDFPKPFLDQDEFDGKKKNEKSEEKDEEPPEGEPKQY